MHIVYDFCTLHLVAGGEGISCRRRDPNRERELALRACLARFATGVVVVTFDTDKRRHGLTVNSFVSVSMRPPLVAVSIATAARAHDLIRNREFCINVLGAEQGHLATCFAGGEQTVVAWEEGKIPRLRGALAHIVCVPWRRYDAGDHSLFIGEVIEFDHRQGDALGFMTSEFTTIAEPSFGLEDLF